MEELLIENEIHGKEASEFYMGFFDKHFKKNDLPVRDIKTEPGKLYSPITGRVIKLEDIPDEVFSQGILGPGCGIEPAEGKVVAPADGIISMVAETKHSVAVTTVEGIELLIHVGMDTVEMNGKGFTLKVQAGQKIVCGQTLLLFDLEEIKKAGHPATTALVITNSDEFPKVEFVSEQYLNATEIIGTIDITKE